MPKFSVTAYAFIILPGAILLSWIRELKTIAPTSIFATVCLAYSFVIIFGNVLCACARPMRDPPLPDLIFRSLACTIWMTDYDISHLGRSVPADPACKPGAGSFAPACATAPKPIAWAGV